MYLWSLHYLRNMFSYLSRVLKLEYAVRITLDLFLYSGKDFIVWTELL